MKDRIATLDAVRGFAVLGILLMNIVGLGLPSDTSVDPRAYGIEGPADLAAWALTFALAEGKMRALFSMLFGASMVLLADRHDGPLDAANAHYRRMFWLFVFGMIHAWLFWFGDILVPYAVAGALGFVLWRWPVERVRAFFAIMFLITIVLDIDLYSDAASLAGDPKALAREVELYRGGWSDAFAARAPMTLLYQLVVLPTSLPEVLAFMALGILLLRSGFLAGALPRRTYVRTMMLGYGVALPLHLPLIWLLLSRDFDAASLAVSAGGALILRPFVALAHAAAVILLVTSGRLRWLSVRLEAAGRMAFTNYLGTTLIATTLFYGYGFGLFGTLSRAELYWVVAAIWAAILLWSKPWLDRYRYGPLEWLWRSLARGQRQPMKLPNLNQSAHPE